MILFPENGNKVAITVLYKRLEVKLARTKRLQNPYSRSDPHHMRDIFPMNQLPIATSDNDCKDETKAPLA